MHFCQTIICLIFLKRKMKTCKQFTECKVWQLYETCRTGILFSKRRKQVYNRHLQSPGISSRLDIPLSTKSISGLLISFASSITFFAFDIFAVFGIHETGGWWLITAQLFYPPPHFLTRIRLHLILLMKSWFRRTLRL